MDERHQRAGCPASYVRWRHWGASISPTPVADMARLARSVQTTEAWAAFEVVAGAYVADIDDNEIRPSRQQWVVNLRAGRF